MDGRRQVIRCMAVALLLVCVGRPSAQERKIDFPLTLSWKVQPSKPGRIINAPRINFKRASGSDVKAARLRAAVDCNQHGKIMTMTFDLTKRYVLSADSGALEADGLSWQSLVESLLLLDHKPSGKGELRIAVFAGKLEEAGKESMVANNVTLTTRLSPWLKLPLEY